MASGSRTRTAKTYLECPECKNIQTIHRKKGKMKEKHHTKHMWCPYCQEVTGHIEVKDEAFFPAWIQEWHEQWEERNQEQNQEYKQACDEKYK